MPRKTRASRRRNRKQQKHNNADPRQALAKAGLGGKQWRQNNLRIPTFRLNVTLAQSQLWLFFSVGVNRTTFRFYEGNQAAAALTPLATQNGESSLWGSYTGQFTDWAALYELYRLDSVSFSFTPASFAGFGSQVGSYSWMDATGDFNAGLISGADIPANFLTEVADMKSLRVHAPFSVVQRRVNFSELILLEQAQSYLQTINTTGVRDEWAAGQVTGPGTSLESTLPACIGCMPIQITNVNPSTISLMCGSLLTDANISFIQRRSKVEAARLPLDVQMTMVEDHFPGFCDKYRVEEMKAEPFPSARPDPITVKSAPKELSESVLMDTLITRMQARGHVPPTTGTQFSSDMAGDGPGLDCQVKSGNTTAESTELDADG